MSRILHISIKVSGKGITVYYSIRTRR